MIDGGFWSKKDGYKIIVSTAFAGMMYWQISKDGLEVDVCYKHSPTYNELAAKEQALNRLKLITTKNK